MKTPEALREQIVDTLANKVKGYDLPTICLSFNLAEGRPQIYSAGARRRMGNSSGDRFRVQWIRGRAIFWGGGIAASAKDSGGSQRMIVSEVGWKFCFAKKVWMRDHGTGSCPGGWLSNRRDLLSVFRNFRNLSEPQINAAL